MTNLWTPHEFIEPIQSCPCCNLSSKGTTLAVAILNIILSIVVAAYACFGIANLHIMYNLITYLVHSHDFDPNGISAAHAFLLFFAVVNISNNILLIFAAKLEWTILCKIYLTVTIIESALSFIFLIMTAVLVHTILGLIWIPILLIIFYNIISVMVFIKAVENFRTTGVSVPGIRLFNGRRPEIKTGERPSYPKQVLKKSPRYVPYEPARIFGHIPSDNDNNDDTIHYSWANFPATD